MNIFFKILLYIFSIFIILNVILFLVLLSTSGKKTIKDKYETTVLVMGMGYIYLILGINELIYGKKPYEPEAENLI
tara:strand:- start:267 stop:494 length:228 start_codon:yes stop_codon:yes gene_type:complete